MKVEKKSYSEFWEYVQAYFGTKDTLTMVDAYLFWNQEGMSTSQLLQIGQWRGTDEVLVFRNSTGELIKAYNVDKGEEISKD